MRPLLRQVGGRQVDGDALGRERQAERRDSAAHALAAFGDRLVAQPDDVEHRDAGDQAALDLDAARLEPKIGDRRHRRDHSCSPHRPLAAPRRVVRVQLVNATALAHIDLMMQRRWRRFEGSGAGRTVLFVVGIALMTLSPVVGVIPGPGGLFVFAAGLGLTLKYSRWAKRRYVGFKRRWPKQGAWVDWGLRRPSAKRRVAIGKGERL